MSAGRSVVRVSLVVRVRARLRVGVVRGEFVGPDAPDAEQVPLDERRLIGVGFRHAVAKRPSVPRVERVQDESERRRVRPDDDVAAGVGVEDSFESRDRPFLRLAVGFAAGVRRRRVGPQTVSRLRSVGDGRPREAALSEPFVREERNVRAVGDARDRLSCARARTRDDHVDRFEFEEVRGQTRRVASPASREAGRARRTRSPRGRRAADEGDASGFGRSAHSRWGVRGE